MRNAIALLCTEHCSLSPPCLPLLQVVATACCSLAVGFGLREIRLEDDLRREALMPSSLFIKSLQIFSLCLVYPLKGFLVKVFIYVYYCFKED